jgi:hypothetical protein
VANVLPASAAGAATLNLAIAASDVVYVDTFDHLSVTFFHKMLLATLNSGHPLTKSSRPALANETEKSGGHRASSETAGIANGKLVRWHFLRQRCESESTCNADIGA